MTFRRRSSAFIANARVSSRLTPKWAEEEGLDEETEIFGYSLADTRAFAMKALERRLKVIGLAPVA